MKYYVTWEIGGSFVAEVEAESELEARNKSIESYWNADFGVLEDIDGGMIMVEDENGEYLWEK